MRPQFTENTLTFQAHHTGIYGTLREITKSDISVLASIRFITYASNDPAWTVLDALGTEKNRFDL